MIFVAPHGLMYPRTRRCRSRARCVPRRVRPAFAEVAAITGSGVCLRRQGDLYILRKPTPMRRSTRPNGRTGPVASGTSRFTEYLPMQTSTATTVRGVAWDSSDADILQCGHRGVDLWGSQSRFGYAAWEYSLINPPRIGRRWTRALLRSTTCGGGFGGRCSSDRCGRCWL